MDNTQNYRESQEAKQLHDRITPSWRVYGRDADSQTAGSQATGSVHHHLRPDVCRVQFLRGIVHDRGQVGRRDVAYDFLKNTRYNWRKFLLSLVAIVVRFMDVLTSEECEKVLIIETPPMTAPVPRWSKIVGHRCPTISRLEGRLPGPRQSGEPPRQQEKGIEGLAELRLPLPRILMSAIRDEIDMLEVCCQ